jgi:hypothetical protein
MELFLLLVATSVLSLVTLCLETACQLLCSVIHFQLRLFFLEMNKCHHSRFVMSHLSSAGSIWYYDDVWMKIVSLPILVV